jgi:hypothetical protein
VDETLLQNNAPMTDMFPPAINEPQGLRSHGLEC